MGATRSLLQGDWQKAFASVRALSCWALMPQVERESVLAQLETQVKRAALTTFLASYASAYSSLSLDSLAERFVLDRKEVQGLISGLLMGEELYGSLDQPTGTVALVDNPMSPLQQLAKVTAEKAGALLDLNERAFTFRSGGQRAGDEEEGPAGRTQDDRDQRRRSRAYGQPLGRNRTMQGPVRLGTGGRGRGDRDRGGRGGGRGDRDNSQRFNMSTLGSLRGETGGYGSRR